jgi:hypothetical protein
LKFRSKKAPSSNIQAPEKFQTPNFKPAARAHPEKLWPLGGFFFVVSGVPA